MPPVSSSGATLNATMYDTPITVPGMAKLTSVRNSNARRPTKRWRVMTYAASRPTTAVSGAAIAATSMVVKRLFHAEPVKMRALLSNVDAEARRGSGANVGVMSPRPMSLTKPPMKITA